MSIFLDALNYSRVVSNGIALANTEDVNLTDVKIKIPGPIGRVTKSRATTLGNDKVLSSAPYTKRSRDNFIQFNVPTLKKGDSFHIYLETFENSLLENEIEFHCTPLYRNGVLIAKATKCCLGIVAFSLILNLLVVSKRENVATFFFWIITIGFSVWYLIRS